MLTSRQGPSIFPILFACVLGRAAHAILVWRLERGERVGTLDLLAGSTSLTSTVVSQLKIGVLSLLGLMLVVLWALSPIGGQASFRQMTTGTKIDTETASFTYPTAKGNLEDFYDNSDRASLYAVPNALFLASLVSPYTSKLATIDTWTNVKIPYIEKYEETSTTDEQGWFTADETHTEYASLIGIPIEGLTDSFMDYTMALQTSYWFLSCPVVYGLWIEPPDTVTGVVAYEDTGAFMWTTENGTRRALADQRDLKPWTFFYESYGPTKTSHCSVTTTYVEADIKCRSHSTCAIKRIRRSQLPHPPPAYTLLDSAALEYDRGWYDFISYFATIMSGHPETQTPIQNYLVSPDDPLALTSTFQSTSNEKISHTTYAARLGQLMNTYWACLNFREAITGGALNTLTTSNVSTGSGTRSTSTTVIKCHDGWVVALSIASAVMIIASLVRPAIYFFLTRAPDVMLNISSLAMRNNPYVVLPSTGTFMSASERARLLKAMRVKFGDVEENAADVGRLAIASFGTATDYRVGDLRRGRLYE